jgi:hypothetical protein
MEGMCMSNNDDFDFNRDELFGDDDSGGDDFGDDFSSDDFDFGDDSDDFNIDDDDFGSDIDSALGGDDDDFGGDDDFTTAESAGGGGSNRNFIAAVVAMLLVFLVGIGLIVWLSTRPNEQQIAFEASRAAIETQNSINSTGIAETGTASIEQATGTQGAIETATAQYTPPTETPTPTLTPTEDLTATAIELQNQQVAIQQTQDAQIAIDLTNTEISFQQTLNPAFTPATTEAPIVVVTDDGQQPQGGSPVSLSDVQQTATALALLFAATPTTSGAQPTDIVGANETPVVIGGGTSSSGQGGGDNGQLPNTGLFDEVFQGNPAFIFLAAFGLLGVIVMSRTVRKRKRED